MCISHVISLYDIISWIGSASLVPENGHVIIARLTEWNEIPCTLSLYKN